MTMDKSVNNFDDVDDTMSSVYNAWRKRFTHRYHQKNKIHTFISPSLSLALFFSGFFCSHLLGTCLILITLNNERFLLLFWHLLLVDSLNLKKHKTTRFHSLQKPHSTPKPKRLFPDYFSDEMLESENSSMAERLYDLERQVLEQQEEILSLKSTLSEVLRRLNNLDCNSSRISTSTSSSSSYETTIKNNRSEYEKLLSAKSSIITSLWLFPVLRSFWWLT